ncbi:hypothetical protein [Cryobacterium sp. Y57]|uniref:hypothetical protein n=1 Tax=Cryobacterium sp. Y57 TaxID=2048287 RepID=UPI000CE50E4A|nr:hypothetical protein [Cryobacterium sp. Y57]
MAPTAMKLTFLGSKRGKGIIASVLVVGVLIIGAGLSQNSAEIEAESRAASEAAARLEDRRVAQAEAAQATAAAKLEADIVDGDALVTSAASFLTESGSYSTVQQALLLQAAIDALSVALVSPTQDVLAARMQSVRSAVDLIGTVEQAASRTAAAALEVTNSDYLAAARAAGKTVRDDVSGVRIGHEYCDRLKNFADTSHELLIIALLNEFDSPRDDAAITYFCPQFVEAREIAARRIVNGSYAVGVDIPAGTYRTLQGVEQCYWERSTGGGDIIDNNFVSFATESLSVTVHDGEGFTASSCGVWTRE